MKKATTIAFVSSSIIATTLFGTPVAQATPSDDRFIAWLDNQHVNYGSNITEIGHSICRLIDSSPTHATVVDATQIGIDSGGYSSDHSAAITVGAIYYYCPQHKDLI